MRNSRSKIRLNLALRSLASRQNLAGFCLPDQTVALSRRTHGKVMRLGPALLACDLLGM